MANKVIYISGPYRAPDKFGISQNISKARRVAMRLWREGWAVICPHMNTAWFDDIIPDDQFIAGDMELIKRLDPESDAVYMLVNWHESKGAQAEHKLALDMGLNVIYEGAIHDEESRHTSRNRQAVP